ncbi:hypothetical protein ACGFX4_17045 [Kitasatospora sp. NPDC048365]|uniref:hypothetical protein n=1 Tax=Kitasatospora sp. NPDC048365 TaxID=3364050 RepID=UPI0037102B25
MTGDETRYDAEEMGALFRAVLEQPEPPASPAVLPEVRRAGGRLRRLRRLAAVGATAAAVCVLATAGWALGGRPPAGAGTIGPAAESPTGASIASPPGASPSGAGRGGHQGLLGLLRAHLPAALQDVTDGPVPGAYTMTRTDGGTVLLGRRLDGVASGRGGAASPCGPRSNARGPVEPDGRDCTGFTLPDGTAVWVLHPIMVPPRGQEAEIRLITPQDRVYVLLFGRGGARPQPDDPTVPLSQLVELARQPGFLEVVRDGWNDRA